MKGLYYKLPLDFQGLMKRKDIDKISIEDSIRQHIFLISTTSFGECKFDESFGSEIWEMDFDLLKSNNNLREMMMNSLKRDISKNEKRVVLEDISVEISDYNLGTIGKNEKVGTAYPQNVDKRDQSSIIFSKFLFCRTDFLLDNFKYLTKIENCF